jgi:hypothetical protein
LTKTALKKKMPIIYNGIRCKGSVVMKANTLTLTFIMALAFSFIFCGILVQPVESQSSETIFIRADGSVEGTTKIYRDGNTYSFTDDISGSIVVERDGVTVDGADYATLLYQGCQTACIT